MLKMKGMRFPKELILVCIRWYAAYALSYRNLEEIMQERGVSVDHSTVNRWAIRFLPMAKPGQYPAFDDLHAHFNLGLVLGLSGPSRQDHRVVVIGKFSGRPIECRFVAIRHAYQGARIVRNDQGR